MDLNLIVSPLTALILAAMGWYVVHRQNLRREITAEKRKLRISYLLEVYRKLESASNRREQTNRSHLADIESAIADIQLLGTPHQVSLSIQFAKDFAEARSASLDGLLEDLRNSLRAELELERISGNLTFLRINPGNLPS